MSEKLTYDKIKKMSKNELEQAEKLFAIVRKEKKDYWKIEENVNWLHLSVSELTDAITFLKKVDLKLTDKFNDVHISTLTSIKNLIEKEWKKLSEETI